MAILFSRVLIQYGTVFFGLQHLATSVDFLVVQAHVQVTLCTCNSLASNQAPFTAETYSKISGAVEVGMEVLASGQVLGQQGTLSSAHVKSITDTHIHWHKEPCPAPPHSHNCFFYPPTDLGGPIAMCPSHSTRQALFTYQQHLSGSTACMRTGVSTQSGLLLGTGWLCKD